jgi:hypothetical protein
MQDAQRTLQAMLMVSSAWLALITEKGTHPVHVEPCVSKHASQSAALLRTGCAHRP